VSGDVSLMQDREGVERLKQNLCYKMPKLCRDKFLLGPKIVFLGIKKCIM